MLTPSRALTVGSAQADPLPAVAFLDELYAWGVRPRKGQMMMIAGQPGSMKSTFGMWWAALLQAPVLYFSADMDAHTAASRLAAVMSGDQVTEVVEAMQGPGSGYYSEILSESKVQFAFDSSPTLDDIADEIDAYVEAHDAFPDLIIIDNLMNVEAEMGESYQGLLFAMAELKRIAYHTGSAVFVLHHTTEGGQNDPRYPQPRRDIQGKVTQLPEVVLTVALDPHSKQFRIAPVKVRSGKSDATGKMFTTLRALPERASFTQYVPEVWSYQ